jgi:hypothetical protein
MRASASAAPQAATIHDEESPTMGEVSDVVDDDTTVVDDDDDNDDMSDNTSDVDDEGDDAVLFRAARDIMIVSGLQIHPERFPNDGNVVKEWSKFPESRQLLYDMVLNSGARGPIFVTGDVHMAQILRKDCVKSADIDAADNGRPNTDAKADIAA